MGREIKFKLWLPEIKRMTYALSLYDWANGYEEITVGEKATWLQFTGLKDKNGKDIYEGDIVILAADQRCIIEYEESRFIAVAVRPPNNFPRDYIYFNNVKEVIGNIYENAELLK